MRCPNCNLFTAEEVEAEWSSSLFYDEGVATGTVVFNKNCAECGETLATAEVEVLVAFDLSGLEEHDLVLYEDSPELAVSDFYRTKDKNGKPIKNSRFWKHFYYANFIVELAGRNGEVSISDEFNTDRVAGSEFEPC